MFADELPMWGYVGEHEGEDYILGHTEKSKVSGGIGLVSCLQLLFKAVLCLFASPPPLLLYSFSPKH